MKFLTREWYEGGHDDDQFFAYRRHLVSISEHLDAPALALALLDLHDARVREQSFDDGVFRVVLRAGFRRLGYSDIMLNFHETQVDAGADDVATILAREPLEIIYHEVDVEADRRITRWLLADEGELTISFTGLDLAQRGVAHRQSP